MSQAKEGLDLVTGFFGAVFEKIGTVFDVFDFSFLLSGSVALTAALCTYSLAGGQLPGSMNEGVPTTWVLAGLGSAYVLGFVVFALGRPMRDRFLPPTEGNGLTLPGGSKDDADGGQARTPELLTVNAIGTDKLREWAQVHGLDRVEQYKRYFELKDPSQFDKFYDRLWADVRQRKELADSFVLVKRYWTFAAAFDGLLLATQFWCLPTGWYLYNLLSRPDILPAFKLFKFDALWIGVFTLLVWIFPGQRIARECARQARDYGLKQMRELFATTAFWVALQEEAAPTKKEELLAKRFANDVTHISINKSAAEVKELRDTLKAKTDKAAAEARKASADADFREAETVNERKK
ncbi:MAG: hypothetical protein JSR77_00080 [Planctomycetes bacterium]|nr:hypothetical protein [Planctomycetota bacterium]